MNAIELKDVNYRSNAFQLQDVSFNVPKGYVTGFIGGNGAGKTTIIRLIMAVSYTHLTLPTKA